MVRRLLVLALNAFKEAIRKKIVGVLLVFALVFIGSTNLLATFTPEEQIKMIQDVGLGGILLFGMLITVFMGMTLIPTEIEKRTIYPLLSMPVRRGEVVAGKYLGGAFTLLFNLFLMTCVFLIVLGFKKVFNFLALKAIFLFSIELLLLLALAVFFSTFVSPTINAASTLFIYVMGLLSSYLKFLGGQAENTIIRYMALFFYRVLPNFQNFNLSSQAVNQMPIPASLILKNVIYGFSYIFVFLILGVIIFSRREV